MRALLQRVADASVEIDGQRVAAIGRGVLALVAVFEGDDRKAAEKLAHRIARYRLFADDKAKLNLSLLDIKGELLLVPQFSLAASTDSGLRPSFSLCASPAEASELFDHFVAAARIEMQGGRVEQGRFGADMRVRLLNEGPLTLDLHSG